METKRTRNGEPPMSGYQVQKVTTLSVGKETGERLAAQMLYTNAVNKLQAVLDQIRKEYGFLRAAEWPVMGPLDASMNVILEDFCGVELNLREGLEL